MLGVASSRESKNRSISICPATKGISGFNRVFMQPFAFRRSTLRNSLSPRRTQPSANICVGQISIKGQRLGRRISQQTLTFSTLLLLPPIPLFAVQRRCWSPENSSLHSSPLQLLVLPDPRSNLRNVMAIISPFVTASTQNPGEIPVPPRTAITKPRAHASTLHVPLGTKLSVLSIPWVLAALSIRELGFPSPVIFCFVLAKAL